MTYAACMAEVNHAIFPALELVQIRCEEQVYTCDLALEAVELLVAIGSECQLLGLLQL